MNWRLFAAGPGILAVLLAGACTTASSPPRRASNPSPRSGQAGRHGQDASVTLAFAGDVNFAGRTARLLSDPAAAFGPIASVLWSADFTALNLETAVTGRGTPQP